MSVCFFFGGLNSGEYSLCCFLDRVLFLVQGLNALPWVINGVLCFRAAFNVFQRQFSMSQHENCFNVHEMCVVGDVTADGDASEG